MTTEINPQLAEWTRRPFRQSLRWKGGFLSFLLVAVAAVTPLGAQGTPAPTPAAGSEAAERPASAPTPRARVESTHTFQLVLVLADNSPGAATVDLPVRAEKALADVREFLPYKSYRLVDLAWLRTSRSAQAQLNGPKGETLRLDMAIDSDRDDRLHVRHFQLSELAMMPPPGSSSTSSPEVRRSTLLETSFGMTVGETVVVGTAKLDGPGKALIAILSAVP